MQRLRTQPRDQWKQIVESQGLHDHTFDGVLYWDESACYQFDSDEIDAIETATYALDKMCLEAVEYVIENELWHDFNIKSPYREWIRQSWEIDRNTVIGRFDLAFDPDGIPKMLEYNADTPTGLLEAAVIQWYWMKDRADGTDQFNSIHERLIEVWKRIGQVHGTSPWYFLSIEGHLEDYMNVNYLRDTAIQAGLKTEYLPIESIGFDSKALLFVDNAGAPITRAFKLYPWEWMMEDEFGCMLPQVPVTWLEAPWKVLLSNKRILRVLWDMFPTSPYLLEASDTPLRDNFVTKPCQSREGNGVQIRIDGDIKAGELAPESVNIYQRYLHIKQYDGKTPVIGSWMINGYAAGIGIREDDGLITGNDSRFLPHFFL